jgi:PleD family two-component response regulator
VNASFGIAVSRAGVPTAVEDLLRRADEAMYQAKRSRNRPTTSTQRGRSDRPVSGSFVVAA